MLAISRAFRSSRRAAGAAATAGRARAAGSTEERISDSTTSGSVAAAAWTQSSRAGARSDARPVYEQILRLRSRGSAAQAARAALGISRRRAPSKPAVAEEDSEPSPVERRAAPPRQASGGDLCRALAVKHLKDPRAAVKAFEKLSATRPNDWCVYKNLGSFYRRLRDDARSRAAYSRYLVLRPAAPDRRAVLRAISAMDRRMKSRRRSRR